MPPFMHVYPIGLYEVFLGSLVVPPSLAAFTLDPLTCHGQCILRGIATHTLSVRPARDQRHISLDELISCTAVTLEHCIETHIVLRSIHGSKRVLH